MGNSIADLADPRFEGVLNDIERATSLEDLQSALERLIAAYGLKQVVYHALRIPSAGIRQAALVHTYPAEWVKHYAERRYYNMDPVVALAERTIVPFDWSDLDRSSKPTSRFFGEARDAGIGDEGITIPIRGAYGERALFTVTGDIPKADWAHARVVYLRDMRLIATYTHNRILAIHGIALPDSSGTPSRREPECLTWAAAGKTVDETAQILTLASSVVRAYLDSARTKLDCVTKIQAVARAVLLGLIHI